MATAQATAAPTRTHLTLKGSTDIVHEFFHYGMQSILYQRGIYPTENFKTVKKYGLQMLVSTDDALQDYLERAFEQVRDWLEKGEISRMVAAIVDSETQETVERWQFEVEVINPGVPEGKENSNPGTDKASALPTTKTDAQVKSEIAAIIKQITASCTYLPMLEENCSFTILAYLKDSATEVPVEWGESDAKLIAEGQAEQVRLRSFSTHVHRVDAMVAYRRGDDA